MHKITVVNLSFYYGARKALSEVSIDIPDRQITALIGPSGCGKSTFLRCLNRMNDAIRNTRVEGRMLLDGADIYAEGADVVALRSRVGMVFQRPNPFPQSIFDNVAFGPRVLGLVEHGHLPAFPEPAEGRQVTRPFDRLRARAAGSELTEIVERSLRAVHLWDEVKGNLRQDALSLSLGQQQRLCIARVIAVRPEVILMDEPCSALDPIATLKVEDLMRELAQDYAIVIVTHNMQQAARASDTTAMMMLTDDRRSGTIIEAGPTRQIFTLPNDPRTEGYVTGRYG